MISMDVSALQSTLEQAQRRVFALEHENAALRQEIRWFDQLLAVPASVMSPSHKVTLRAAVKAYQRGAPDERGLVQIESWKLCKTVGQSKDTFLDNLAYCEQLGVLRKQTHRTVTEDGAYTTTLAIGVTDLLARPDLYRADRPRNHGGERIICPHCRSDRLQRKVTVTCMACGSVLDTKTAPVNRESAEEPVMPGIVNLTTNITRESEGQVADTEKDQEQEPTTPPVDAALDAPVKNQDQRQAITGEDPIMAAAQLLVDIAGPGPVHIEMSPRGPKKYYDVPRSFTLQDARAHLKGWKTKGAYLRHPDGKTRAVCYDADTPDDWSELRLAARLLTLVGYRPLLEDSPVGRGGHMWIIYTGPVDVARAHRHLQQHAPALRQIKESWPGPGPNKVRLPGGRYVKPGLNTWCPLYNAYGLPLATHGAQAAQVLLMYQTPAHIIPDDFPDPEPEPAPLSAPGSPAGEQTNRDDQARGNDMGGREPSPAWVDNRWQQKYGKYLWFQFTPAQLAAWYNEQHQVEELLPPEKNGMGLASWRGEHTASVGLREAGWVDFGASARRADGKPDGGDALELQVRISEQAKPDVMREAARDLVCKARIALEDAARNGQLPPEWIQTVMSPAGWQHYHEVRAEAEQNEQKRTADPLIGREPAPHTGGVAGFYQGAAGDTSIVRDTPEFLAAEIGIVPSKPCEQCGCTLRYQSGDYLMCHKCHPRPLRLGGLRDDQWRRLQALFPHRIRL